MLSATTREKIMSCYSLWDRAADRERRVQCRERLGGLITIKRQRDHRRGLAMKIGTCP
jgi:hypothetical protein